MIPAARIIEIFSSIQGEGVYVGQWHLFVRFWDCNLSCHYCDTDYRGAYQELTREELLSRVEEKIGKEGPHQAVSLTGGEPLLWWKFLREFLPTLKALGQRVYLETNGTLPDALREVMPWVDTIAMDVKPPSATGGRPLWRSHEAFLRLGVEAKRDLFVKIVVTPETSTGELEGSFKLIAGVDSEIPVVLQPVTPCGAVSGAPEEFRMDEWRRLAGTLLRNVEVIPQVHRLLGVP
ncbi:MAG: 7-carboxy-7-deazaguanine synthase QueE [Candidatus Omnitrophica bacterium]|nr:7-carboxy-7-deazaguanine synthase QueE [Candidatus Omnitrophota bacterium]